MPDQIMSDQKHYAVVIVGAGTAGLSVAARLARTSQKLKGQIVVIDPATKHYYQPLWTLVGAGAAKKESTEREQASLIPAGVDWIREAVATFSPDSNSLVTQSGAIVSYDYLVVAAGLHVNWDGIEDLKETIGKNGVCSNYAYETVDSTWQAIRQFKGGRAIFTHPNTPVKCGGAPQKIMYLADDNFRKSGVREGSKVVFASANASIFAVKKYADTLEKVIQRKQITTMYRRNLIALRPKTREAVFEHLDTKDQEVLNYDMIHVTPPMHAPAFIQKSPLADQAGWVDVDKYTLQHNKYPRVFGIGDCSNLPTSKTGAAIRKQAPVVVSNLFSLMKGEPLAARYDGYTSCPLVTGYGRLVLAEFDYDLQPRESFPFDQSRERYSMYVLKKDLLPIMYWRGMLKGLL